MKRETKNQVTNRSYAFYNEKGREYVAQNREFYSSTPDTGRNFTREAIKERIAEKTIADIGCGAGDDIVAYSKMGAAHVIGIEPSYVMLEEAKKTLKANHIKAELLEGEWEHIPLADESVDIVTSRYSFHVQSKFNTAFKEITRVLKPKGLFILMAPHPLHDAKMVREQSLQSRELMSVPIFKGKFTVKIPPHKMEDYLSETCLKYFDCEDKFEYSMHENPKEAVPTGIVLKLRKK